MLRNSGKTGGGTKAPVFALMLANIASELQPRPRLQPRGLFHWAIAQPRGPRVLPGHPCGAGRKAAAFR